MSLGQLGTLAFLQGDLTKAEARYREALGNFKRLDEKPGEATGWHQLGMVTRIRAASIRRSRPIVSRRDQWNSWRPAGAASTWVELATNADNDRPGRPAGPRKKRRCEATRATNDALGESVTLINLLTLVDEPGRLAEAHGLPEAALAVIARLDLDRMRDLEELRHPAPESADYVEGNKEAARRYRSQAREEPAAAPIARERLKSSRPHATTIVAAATDPEASDLEADLEKKY